ncbi:MAG: hypothetical protein KDK45_24805, partial [Leptospiraceae bacterium]|nr:hypothetical protein [Leptospiraceae bacterium]
QFRNYYNLMITMVIGGIWHGAAWTFFFWGLLHAVFLAIERFFIGKGWSVFFQRIPRPIGILYTFSLFSLGALFFRSKDMGSVMISLQKAFTFADGKMVSLPYAVLIPVALLIIYEIFEESSFTIPKTFFYETLKNVTVLTVLILCFLIYSVTVSPQFYYFQF